MPQSATKSALTSVQIDAIDNLLSGSTVTDVAKAIGVDRSTIHRWRKDPTFIAEFNRRSAELQNATFARLQQIALAASQAVEDAIRDGNVQVSLAVLKGMGFLGGVRAEIGWDDPERIEYEQTQAELQRDRDEMMERMLHSLQV